MSWLAGILRAAVEAGVSVFDGLGPLLGLTLLSCITGALMLWIVGKTTPQARLERARSRVAAAVYEMRLFIDSPGRVIRAQGHLFSWFAWYMALLLPAFLMLSIPLGLFLLHLETRHGLDALPVGQSIVMRVDLADGADGYQVTAGSMETIEVPDDAAQPGSGPGDGTATRQAVRVTAPPLYIEDEGRVYFRLFIDPTRGPGEYSITIRAGDASVEKRISADPEATSVSPERRAGWGSWYQLGDEEPLPDGPFEAVILEHPDRSESWLGLAIPWWAYWLILSTIVALLLRRPMGVVL